MRNNDSVIMRKNQIITIQLTCIIWKAVVGKEYRLSVLKN